MWHAYVDADRIKMTNISSRPRINKAKKKRINKTTNLWHPKAKKINKAKK
jgi:hypothetical protein